MVEPGLLDAAIMSAGGVVTGAGGLVAAATGTGGVVTGAGGVVAGAGGAVTISTGAGGVGAGIACLFEFTAAKGKFIDVSPFILHRRYEVRYYRHIRTLGLGSPQSERRSS